MNNLFAGMLGGVGANEVQRRVDEHVTTQIQANIPGLGNVPFTPPVGWTALDFEDGTELSLVTGSDTTVILRVSNTSLGANAL
jgi:hypothetical protein